MKAQQQENPPVAAALNSILQPQLNRIVSTYIKRLEKEVGAILSRCAAAGNLQSSSHVVQRMEAFENITRECFAALARQILHTLDAEGYTASEGLTLFNQASIEFVNLAYPMASKNIMNGRFDGQFSDKRVEIINMREEYGQQLSVGYVDGASWKKTPAALQIAQVQHYGDNIQITAEGQQSQINYHSHNAKQINSVTNNDLLAIQSLLAAIQEQADIPAQDKEDVSQCLELVLEEAQKPAPNYSRIKSMGNMANQALKRIGSAMQEAIGRELIERGFEAISHLGSGMIE
jgi:hypothetical protein